MSKAPPWKYKDSNVVMLDEGKAGKISKTEMHFEKKKVLLFQVKLKPQKNYSVVAELLVQMEFSPNHRSSEI